MRSLVTLFKTFLFSLMSFFKFHLLIALDLLVFRVTRWNAVGGLVQVTGPRTLWSRTARRTCTPAPVVTTPSREPTWRSLACVSTCQHSHLSFKWYVPQLFTSLGLLCDSSVTFLQNTIRAGLTDHCLFCAICWAPGSFCCLLFGLRASGRSQAASPVFLSPNRADPKPTVLPLKASELVLLRSLSLSPPSPLTLLLFSLRAV